MGYPVCCSGTVDPRRRLDFVESLGEKPDATLKLAVVIQRNLRVHQHLGRNAALDISSRPFRHYVQSPGIYYPLHVHHCRHGSPWRRRNVAGIRLLDLPRRRMGLAVLSGVLLIWIPLAQRLAPIRRFGRLLTIEK